MRLTILVDPSLVIITIILSLFDLSLGVEKKIFKEIMHVHYVTYDHALAQEPLHRGS